jgi:Flp pilus assembly protein CpaB
MKLKTLLLFETVCVLVVVILGSRFGAEDRSLPRVERIDVLVAGQDMVAGTFISEPTTVFRRCSFLKGTEPTGAIRDPYELKNARLGKPLASGQHVTADDLTDYWTWMRSDPWPREADVTVDAANVVGGFVLPNTRVDIQSVAVDPKGISVAQNIIENALVLSLRTTRHRLTGAILTVQVRNPEEQERLSKVNTSDTIRLIVKPGFW